MTLWHYCHSDSVGEKPELGQTLRTFHASLADFPEPLSPFTEKVDDGASLFGSERATPALDRGDRKLALRVHEALIRDLGADSSQWLKLHGEPHEGNVAWAKSRPVFIDFEAACFGPLEWDLAYLPDEAIAAFPTRDDELLAVLRIAVSLVWRTRTSALLGFFLAAGAALLGVAGLVHMRYPVHARPPPAQGQARPIRSYGGKEAAEVACADRDEGASED